MKPKHEFLPVWLLFLPVAWCTCLELRAVDPPPRPLIQAHAHNDYEHARPLLDALDAGFCSVEADIYLVDSKLLVAHDRSGVEPERTLEALYLEPLRQRARMNGGRVYAGGPEVSLLIDLKEPAKKIYPALRRALEEYSDILSSFDGDKETVRAVRVILTGERTTNMLAGEATRYASIDGTLAELDSGLPADLVPWISSRWGISFSWNGDGAMPQEQRLKLQQLVAKAHQQGRRVRFWGSPDKLPFWKELLFEKVDLINTDNLKGVQDFLAAQPH